MSDNPMYWPGNHQRPAWHQQPTGAPPQPPVNPMNHYANHPGQMLSNPMVSPVGGMPPPPGSDPSALQVQSQIPGAGRTPQAPSQQGGSAPPSQSSIYTTMMPPSGPASARPSTQQLNSTNSHLTSASATQGIQPPPGPHQGSSLQQQPPTHQQSHYSHQYSSLGPNSYWPQSGLSGPTGQAPPPPPGSQPSDATNAYHSSSASSMTMPNDSRGSMSGSSASASSFLSSKDIQSSNDHMMSYDRQRGAMPQQPHPSAMMAQNVPSSTASNLSPNPNQVGGMRSMSQQPASWTNSYYGASTQSPYVSPYMPYGSSGIATNHSSTLSQAPRPPPSMTQKIPVNGADRTRGVYPTHSSMYGQPPAASGTNGSYYGYDSYYNQVASQPPLPPTDPYLSHPSSASSQQHWSSPAVNNQMISNNAGPPGPLPPTMRPQAGPTASIHPQSPSAPSSLPSLPVRPPPQSSQTPDRSPAPPQHSASYPSPNQQASSSKSTSNSLAQLEQMVMPNSAQSTTPSIKSPTHRSSTSSPSTRGN